MHGFRPPDSDLGPRLEAVCSMVGAGARVADVGTDHGRVPIALVDRGLATWCVAIETHESLLRGVRVRLGSDPVARPIDVRVGDGLAPVTAADRIDTVVLAGMGSDTVVRILDRADRTRIGGPRVIVQPQTEPHAVRAWFHAHAHVLIDERIVHERGRSYVVLAAEPGVETGYRDRPGLEPGDLYAGGPLLIARRDPAALVAWTRAVRRLDRIVERLPRGTGERTRHTRDRARRIVEALSSN